MKALMLPARSTIIMIALGIISLAAIISAAIFVRPAAAPAINSYGSCSEAGYPILQTDPPACVYNHHTFVGPKAPPAASLAPVVSIAYELLVQGNSGGDYPNKQQVITSQADWVAYWHHVHAGLPTVPPILPVNFATSNVVALSLGARSTGGYGLKITGIVESPTSTTISFTQSAPGPHCLLTPAVTNPYLIVQTPVLVPPVNFRLTEEKRQC